MPAAQFISVAQDTSPHLVVNTSFLNVRSGPGANHSIITTVRGGTVLPVTMVGSKSVWYQVNSPAGSGWVNSNYTVPRGNFTQIPRQGLPTNLASGTGDIGSNTAHLVVNTSFLNVRTGPGIGYDVLTIVKGGTNLRVRTVAADSIWYQVDTSAGTGWVNSRYAVTRGDFTKIPRQGLPTNLASGAGDIDSNTPHLVVNTSFLNVRTGPGAGHAVLTIVKGGTNLAVRSIAADGVWYQVDTSAGTGWVNSRYGVTRGNFRAVPRAGVLPREGTELSGTTPRAVVNTYRLNVRSGPSASHDIVATTGGGSVFKVLGLSSDRNWYLVEGSFGQGWLRNDYTVFRGDFSQVHIVS